MCDLTEFPLDTENLAVMQEVTGPLRGLNNPFHIGWLDTLQNEVVMDALVLRDHPVLPARAARRCV